MSPGYSPPIYRQMPITLTRDEAGLASTERRRLADVIGSPCADATAYESDQRGRDAPPGVDQQPGQRRFPDARRACLASSRRYRVTRGSAPRLVAGSGLRAGMRSSHALTVPVVVFAGPGGPERQAEEFEERATQSVSRGLAGAVKASMMMDNLERAAQETLSQWEALEVVPRLCLGRWEDDGGHQAPTNAAPPTSHHQAPPAQTRQPRKSAAPARLADHSASARDPHAGGGL